MRVCFYTLGCKVNQNETGALAQLFEQNGFTVVEEKDGCNRRCAYCVIPRARGPVRSRSEISILEELRRLAASGYCEVVLTAISLPSYGKDT